jgi:tRNA(Ile)-lysidine synthase
MVMESARHALSDLEMIPDSSRVLVAVSGGVDSIVLLDVLKRLSSERSLELVVGTVDHGLRGKDSARDATFVQEVADSYGLRFAKVCLTPEDIEFHRSHGREGAARHARLSALTTLADQVGATRIALGHSLDDHAETILYRLARGTGPTGLRGIAPIRLPFIRPLIRVSRNQIQAYAIAQSLAWREDATNADPSFARNRIRHHIMPELRAINPRITDALARNANLLADLDEATAYLLNDTVSGLITDMNTGNLSLSRDRLRRLPEPILRLALREGVRRARGDLNGITFAHIDALRMLVTGPQAHAEQSLPGIHVRMQGDAFTLLQESPAGATAWHLHVDMGETQLPEDARSLTLEIAPIANVDLDSIRADPWTEAADADCITPPMQLRTRQAGDRFAPLGLGQEIKLKDFLMNEHTAYFNRDLIPLLCDSRRIIWVVGIRLSDTVKLSNRTQQVLVMKMKGVR